jgi:4-hydroxymandelate oxidase
MTIRDAAVDLSRIIRIADFETIAAERMDPAAFDYLAGGAWDERSLREAVEAWQRRRLRPRVLIDVSHIDPSATMAGDRVALPFGIAPMAAHGLAHPDAELATARAAAAAFVPFAASTMSTVSMEEIAAAAPDGINWFQLYTQADPGVTRSLVERAEAAGYRAILVTVDLPVLGYRERDLRSGFDLAVPHGNFPETGPDHAGHDGSVDGGYDLIRETVDRGLIWDDLATLRTWTRLPLFLKGILTAEDARLALDHGVDGIIVSNHGARQLDRTVTTVDALEEIVAVVGDRLEVWVDGGIRRGLDIVTALALGARGVLVGRPMLYALAAGGEAGVSRAIEILRTETILAMTLLGTPTVADLRRAHVEERAID